MVCTQLNGFKYSKWLNSSSRPLDGTLTDITNPSQSGQGSISHNGVLNILQSSRTGDLKVNGLILYSGHSFRVGLQISVFFVPADIIKNKYFFGYEISYFIWIKPENEPVGMCKEFHSLNDWLVDFCSMSTSLG